MNKKVLVIFLIAVIIIILVIIYILKNNSKNIANLNNEINNSLTENIVENSNINNSIDKNEESEEKMNTTIKVNIDNKNYIATLEQNETTKKFINMLPQEFNMNELNGNEKYVYLNYTLPTKEYNPKHIEAGDIMLYGNNCLVVFYKSFDTSYSYTKIGHIESLNELENKNVLIKFEK